MQAVGGALCTTALNVRYDRGVAERQGERIQRGEPDTGLGIGQRGEQVHKGRGGRDAAEHGHGATAQPEVLGMEESGHRRLHLRRHLTQDRLDRYIGMNHGGHGSQRAEGDEGTALLR